MIESAFDSVYAYLGATKEQIEFFEELVQERQSDDPNGIRIQTVLDVLFEQDYMRAAIRLITDDQMRARNINKYGQLLPKYKPSTIRKKIRAGFPPSEVVRYTNYWTGTLRKYCIKIIVDLSDLSYDFKVFDYPNSENSTPLSDMGDEEQVSFLAPNGFKPYSVFIPPDRIGLTDENIEKFENAVMAEVTRRLDIWMGEQLRNAGINPIRFGIRA